MWLMFNPFQSLMYSQRVKRITTRRFLGRVLRRAPRCAGSPSIQLAQEIAVAAMPSRDGVLAATGAITRGHVIDALMLEGITRREAHRHHPERGSQASPRVGAINLVNLVNEDC